MMIVNTNEQFCIRNTTYPGLPILLDRNFEIVRPVFLFTVYLAVQDARIQSLKTIKSYVSSLYDYFSFLEANDLMWNEPYLNDAEHFSLSVVALYRNWSKTLVNSNNRRTVSDSTINLRLSVLKRFYEYCFARELIKFKPWETLFKVQPESIPSFFRHTRGQKVLVSNDLVLKTYKKVPKLLNIEQCRTLINAIDNRSFKLMTKLMLSAGLRKDEVISLNINSIIEPSLSQCNKRIPLDLDPHTDGQRTKGSKARRVFISVILMRDLWDFINFGERVTRGKLHLKKKGYISPFIFLNRFGNTYSKQSLNNFYTTLKENKQIDFKVSPHMLRHTYATIELYAESQRVGTTKALAWLQKRMGHSSIITTSTYLHCIEILQEHELSTYQAELDDMG
ncbi:tyrosine-type recombinase/integrase [Motilimonas sp. 1_MG-2023]|uniref:tyrosine-type recombinase/integrase n=1 Tax=Motilimonas sp. 1_MG-2023 TaxID=3062672 RepID=UPI0026E2E4D3|nr:tyrosine-type recombinase/integrase [Motilimonas sp. 1_MG-2023]MDO6524716.1 tyrosine-type recombinase/integrase [Motilimonas sp. 1_MG-2023]